MSKPTNQALFVIRAATLHSVQAHGVVTVLYTDMSGWIYRNNLVRVTGWLEGYALAGLYYPVRKHVLGMMIPTASRLRQRHKPVDITPWAQA